MTCAPVSVIVPAYNCEKTISQTLKGILAQNYSGPFEVIVVDDGSSDATATVVKSFEQIKYIRQENRGPASARNRGLKESSGETVFFTDSDCVPEVDWISKAIVHFSKPETAVVAGSYGIINAKNLLARCIHKEIIFRHERRMPAFPKSFGSYNFCARKKILEAVGGFNEEYPLASGEDNDLSYKISKHGYKIYFEKNSRVHHRYPQQLLRYLVGQHRHGFWRVKMYLDHPGMARGDDYTFWKDIFEPAAVAVFILCLALSPFSLIIAFFSAFFLPILLIIEFFYGWLMTKNILETIFFSLVMLARAFFRTVGFFAGILHCFLPKPAKKS